MKALYYFPRIILAVLIFLLSPFSTKAADLYAKLYSTQSGLSDNTVRTILQDHMGYLWFGTLNGLTRFDGYTMTPIPYRDSDGNQLYEPKIRQLHEDSFGNLWVLSTNDRVSCIDLENLIFRNFIPDDGPQYFRYIHKALDNSLWLFGEKGAINVSEDPEGKIHTTVATKESGVLPSNVVYKIFDDHNGNTFISTDKGIVRYSNGKAEIIDFSRQIQWFAPFNDLMLAVATNGDVVSIDKNGKISLCGTIPDVSQRIDLPGHFLANGKWHISYPQGMYSLDLNTFNLEPSRLSHIPNAKVITDNSNNVWLHNESGNLWRVDTVSETAIPYRIIPEEKMKLIDMERYAILNNLEGDFIVTTNGCGFYTIDEDSGNITHHAAKEGPLPSDNLLSVLKDESGAVWIGSEDIGVAKILILPHSISDIADDNKKNPAIRMVKRLSNGNIAISYYDGSFDTYDSTLRLLSSRRYPKVVYDMTEDGNGHVWKATRGAGIFFEDLDGNSVQSKYNPSFATIFSILKDSKDRIWIGTLGKGLDVAIPVNNGVRYEQKNFLNDTYGRQRIRAIFEDSGNNIWVGTNEGVYSFNPDSLIAGLPTIKEYGVANKSLNTNEVSCIAEDHKGRIWIGEGGGGITIFDKADGYGKISHIRKENGLPNSNIQSFVKEGDNYIWAFTNLGAARINVETLNVESFMFQSNTLGNVYKPNSSLMLPDGRLLLGSSIGAYVVNLNNLAERAKPNMPIPTSLRINGETLSDGHIGNNLWSALSNEREIVLPHDENSIDITFSTFNYNSEIPDKFRYMLEPYDKNWSEFSDDNHVSFRNLTPGKYTLKVQALNTSGEWSEINNLKIEIRHPWWGTWWAKTIYILLIILAIALFMFALDRIRTLHGKVKREKELTDFKLEFYTNISHEFRTPLTLIQASIEKTADCIAGIKAEHPEVHVSPMRSSLSTLDKNAKRMLRLIEELLTFRKIERNKLVLSYEPTEVVAFVRDLFNNFVDEAKSKEIDYSFHSNEKEYLMNLDRNALDKIVTNLISNAIKYTYEKGRVEVNLVVNRQSGKLEIQVRDNGIGIPDEKKSLLFSRFMQTGFSRSSIGVGLHLTSGLVKLHQGSITHSDNDGGGSVFTVILPLNLKESVNKVDDALGRPKFSSFEENPENENPENGSHENKMDLDESGVVEDESPENRRTILVIDDDTEIRKLLHDEFSSHFNVLTASNGHTGLELARQNDVNLVICDVMMPDISGFKVTRMLKEDFATSHIPVIQLTALNNDDSQYEGMECGADAYVTKPFKLKYLKMLVSKIMERYETMVAKFSANPSLPKPQIPLSNRDSEFAGKLAEVILKNMDNAEFSVDDFSAQMAMGRTVFFKKVKGVTGYSPKEYIRVMRMKHAAELLLTTVHTITEISFMVGISDPSYFNKCFKAQFGKAPSVYKKENTSQPSPDNEHSLPQ